MVQNGMWNGQRWKVYIQSNRSKGRFTFITQESNAKRKSWRKRKRSLVLNGAGFSCNASNTYLHIHPLTDLNRMGHIQRLKNILSFC